jgi:hypothetical protein
VVCARNGEFQSSCNLGQTADEAAWTAW